ncbi:TetR family transcriptional regulator [Salmonella enterica subsp. enterica serovar Choleraesuis]|nr:TetR family transcriptional regulator [Salmonella enterica subsp. enterica serovar Choleraesuis]
MTAQKANSEHQPQPRPRRPGRPRGASVNADSRNKLLDAALSLFARQGIAETSLNAIAREAGVTSAMLHYYFNSREQLLDVMIEERFLPLRRDITTVLADNAESPSTALLLMTERLAELADTYPWFAPLWLQEVLGETNQLRQHMHARFGKTERNNTLATIIRWQNEGKLNRELEPALIFTSLLSLILVPFCMLRQQQNTQEPFNFDRQAIVNHALTLLKGGIGQPQP